MNSQEPTKTVSQLALWVFFAFSILFPLFFLPITADVFETNKKMLLFVCATVLTGGWILKTIMTKTIRITTSPVLIPSLLLAAATVASTFIANAYRYHALTGKTLILVAMTFVFLTATALISVQQQQKKWLFYALSIPITLLCVFSLLQTVGFGLPTFLNKAFGLQIQNTILFQLSGSLLASTSLMVPMFFAHIIELFATKEMRDKTIHSVFAGILAAGLIVHAYYMMPGKEAQIILLPMQASWSIALDTLKSVKLALFGVGPESYVDAFTQFRPSYLNTTVLWTTRFGSARSELFQQLTTVGVVGLVAWILFQLACIKLALPLKDEHRPISIFLLGMVLFHIFFPATTVSLVMTYLAAAAIVLVKKSAKQTDVRDTMLHLFAFQQLGSNDAGPAQPHQASQILAYGFSLLLGVGLVVASFVYRKVYASELTYFQSLVEAQKNNVDAAYQLQAKAVAMQPENDSFRRAFASTNFFIASAISQNQQATEQQKGNIAPLLQQAIQEARTATQLNPRSIHNWETLAGIYREFIGVAQGAEQWTISAFVNAIQVDPSNAMLRYELGNIYLRIQNPEMAAQLYRQAIELKPDYIPAYYNLYLAYSQKEDKFLALDALQQTEKLLPADSPDRPKIEKDLQTLTTEVEALIKQQQEQQEMQQKQQTQKSTQTPAQEQQDTPSFQEKTEPALPQEEIKIPQDLGLPEATPPVSVPETGN